MLTRILVQSLAITLGVHGLGAQDPVEFARDIEPIFAARCYECHGAKEQEGDLRLDDKAAVFHANEDAWVIKPGDPTNSLLVQRIKLPKDDADVMPAEGDPLTLAQIDLIERWVKAGAPWPDKDTAASKLGHKPAVEVIEVQLSDAEKKAVDGAVAALAKRGAVVGPIARDLVALDVNLSLLRPPATDADVALLRDAAPALVWLSLSRTQVTDAGLAPLASCRALRRLHLAQTGIGDAGLLHLRNLTELRFLNLFGTKVTDQGLAHLHGLRQLAKLFLWQTAVTDAGVAALQKALPQVVIDRGGYAEEIVRVSAEQAAAEAKEKAALPPGIANSKCPVASKPIDPEITLEHDGRKVAFCCADCRAKFAAEPAKFVPNLPPLPANDADKKK
jgi:hypothetical protein